MKKSILHFNSSTIANLVLSIGLLLIVSEPYVENFGVVSKIFILISGILIIILYSNLDELLFISSICIYLFFIVAMNGFNSLRLGALSAVVFGLLISKAKIIPGFIVVYFAVVLSVLFTITSGFDTPVGIGGQAFDGGSINYFGQILFQILIIGILTFKKNESVFLALFVGLVSIFIALFIPSRQLILTLACCLIFIIVNGKFFKYILLLLILYILLILDYENLPVYKRFFYEGGGDIGRSQILDCYLSKINIMDIIIGSDLTDSGSCGLQVIGVKYLHNGYLEAISELGLLGFMAVIAYPFLTFYFYLTKRVAYFWAFIFAGIYQVAEGGFLWLYFIELFFLFRIFYFKKIHSNDLIKLK